MLFPAIQTARSAARKSLCTNNKRQIGLALLTYEEANGGFPRNRNNETGGSQSHGAFVELRPFMEASSIYAMWNWQMPLNDASNERFVLAIHPCIQCPSSPGENRTIEYNVGNKDVNISLTRPADYSTHHKAVDMNDGTTHKTPLGYGVVKSARAEGNAVVRIDNFTDGPSNTIIYHEHSGMPSIYFDNTKIGECHAHAFALVVRNSSPAGHGGTSYGCVTYTQTVVLILLTTMGR